MSRAVIRRAAAIRHYLRGDSVTVFHYSQVAARWETLRLLLLDRGAGTPADEHRFAALTATLRHLTAQLGLTACTDDSGHREAVVGITDPDGFLPGDPQRILCANWREAAKDW